MNTPNSYLQAPRVLISYARADGEEASQKINELLATEGIPVWQDEVGAVGLEGGMIGGWRFAKLLTR